MIAKIVMALLVAHPSFATICLRAPQVAASEFRDWVQRNPQCEHSEELLYRQMQTDPDQDLAVLSHRLQKTQGLRKKQVEVFRDFFEHKKKQAWSPRTVDVVVEVLKRWSQEVDNPKEILQMIEQLETGQTIVGESTPPQESADAVIYRNGLPQKNIQGTGQNHWVVFSSAYRPIVMWGTAIQMRERVRQERRPWLTGTCEKPALNFNTTKDEDYLFLYPGGCIANRPAWVRPISKNPPTIMTVKQPRPLTSEPLFWIVGVAAAAVVFSAAKKKN